MKTSPLLLTLTLALVTGCPAAEPDAEDTGDDTHEKDAAPAPEDAGTDAEDPPDADKDDAGPPPEGTLRARICGDQPWTFTGEGSGPVELVAEQGSIEGTNQAFSFLEGPVWYDGALHFSDFNRDSPLDDDDMGPPSIVWRLADDGGVTAVWPEGSVRSNGMAVDELGRLHVSDHAARGITRVAADGTRTVLSRKALTNVAFGGPNHDVLYVTEQKKLHRIQMPIPGMPY